ncbi:MAG: hypothetical protein JKY67_17135 [Pseudomonadales bacterium]|nr:hypothetical protein [Pseudomonadales bacterium]
MTMRLTQLKTHWNADEAETIIDFLDDLRDVIVTSYAQEIKEEKQKRTDGQDDYNRENIDDSDII